MDYVNTFVEYIMTPSNPVFIVGGLIVLLMPFIMHFWYMYTATYTVLPSVLIAGPSGAGKTALLTLFERRTSPSDTHTSQAPCTAELSVDEARRSSYRDNLDDGGHTAVKFLAVDTPGHGKLRHHALERLTPDGVKHGKLEAIVFVVDAAAISEPGVLADTAGYLYEVLLLLQRRMSSSRTSKAPHTIPVLVAANKTDLFTALPARLVKSNLEKELGRIRRTRSKGLMDSGAKTDEIGAGDDEADNWLGEYGSQDFKFDQMREFDIDIDVEGGAVLGDKPNVDRWWTWIGQNV